MENTGNFFVIESTNGVDAHALLTRLEKRLVTAGHQVVTLNFPRLSEPSGYFAAQYKQDIYGSNGTVGPYTGSLFFTLDHYQAAGEIRKALSDGKVVIANKFIGSILAEQGSLFDNDEERRGYYIWLDNLEFVMLKIPRPHKNFILRTAGSDRSTQIYDDLCNMFPRDFQRIDVERSGQPLSEAALTDLLWAAIEPQLPVKVQPENNDSAVADTATKNSAVTEPGVASRRYQLNDISMLLAHRIETSGLVDFLDNNFSNTDPTKLNQSGYFTPGGLDKASLDEYQKIMDSFFESYKLLAKKHQEQPSNERLGHAIKAILPTATKTNLIIYGSPNQIQNLISLLRHSQLPEALQIAKQLTTELLKREFGLTMDDKLVTSQPVSILPSNYGQQQDSVRLAEVWPRNEIDLLGDAVYEQSHLSTAEIRQTLTSLDYAQKEKVLTAYLNQHAQNLATASALQQVHYQWDLLTAILTLRDLVVAQPGTQMISQPLTPRYGFDVPKVIENAGLSDLYEQCFDDSLRLHSMLAVKDEASAQYAVLLGHKTRATYKTSAIQLANLQPASVPARRLLSEMRQKQAEVHPLIAEASYNVDKA